MNTNIDDITISSSAVLVYLNIRSWSAKTIDREVSSEVIANKQCKTNRAGAFTKELLGDSVELDRIQKKGAQIRLWFHQNTLPWSDTGQRLLPALHIQDFAKKLGDMEAEYNALVVDFQAAYRQAVQVAQFGLDSMFRASDYPDENDIPSKFKMSYTMSPLPASGDFRIDIGRQGLNDLKDRFESAQQQRINDAMGEVRDRMKVALNRVAKQWRAEGKMYQSSVDAALELCEAVRGFNLTRDPELEAMANEFRGVLSGYDLKDMKKDEVVRTAAHEEISGLLDKFSLM